MNTTFFARLALAIGFLSAVADRFGGWGLPGNSGVVWGRWDAFVAYTGQLTDWLLPFSAITYSLAVIATGLEILLGLLLLVGYQTRKVALGSGWLLLLFALSMTISAGSPKAALDYSVFAASAAAFLLASAHQYPFSLDHWLQARKAL